jgi:hypothetical protein
MSETPKYTIVYIEANKIIIDSYFNMINDLREEIRKVLNTEMDFALLLKDDTILSKGTNMFAYSGKLDANRNGDYFEVILKFY